MGLGYPTGYSNNVTEAQFRNELNKTAKTALFDERFNGGFTTSDIRNAWEFTSQPLTHIGGVPMSVLGSMPGIGGMGNMGANSAALNSFDSFAGGTGASILQLAKQMDPNGMAAQLDQKYQIAMFQEQQKQIMQQQQMQMSAAASQQAMLQQQQQQQQQAIAAQRAAQQQQMMMMLVMVLLMKKMQEKKELTSAQADKLLDELKAANPDADTAKESEFDKSRYTKLADKIAALKNNFAAIDALMAQNSISGSFATLKEKYAALKNANPSWP